MKKVIWFLAYAVGGGLVFWVPDVILHAIRGKNIGGLEMLFLTILLPLLTIYGFKLFLKVHHNESNRLVIAVSMFLGIWILGPLMMATGASFAGGTFFTSRGWKVIVMGTFMFPVFTFEMATYDGTLFALGLASLCLVLVPASILERFFNRLFSSKTTK